MSLSASPAAQHAAVVAYYGAVATALLGHLAGREVLGFGSGLTNSRHRGVTLHISDADDLDEAVRSGVVGFRLPGSTGPGRLALRIVAGQDSGIDTVATTALALMELMNAEGVATTAMLDGAGGLYLAGTGADAPAAARYARTLAESSPEIATTSRADTPGRALIEPLPAGGDGIRAPYSLVEGPSGLAVIAPLTRDEVAAATAGMPLDIEPSDMPERIRLRGDLAVELLRRPELDA